MSVIKQLGVKQSDGTYTVTDFSVKAENIDGDVIVWNLLPAVDDVRIKWKTKSRIKSYSYDYSNGTYTLITNTPHATEFQQVYMSYTPMPEDMLALRGKQFIYHMDSIDSSYSNANPRIFLQVSTDGTTDTASYYLDKSSLSKTFTMPSDALYYRLWLRADHTRNNSPEDTVVTFKGIKLELGNKATEWTPYLDDINKYTASLNNRTTALENKTTDEAIVNTVALNMKVGGRNLLIGSETKQLTKNPTSGDNAPTINYATNQSVAEWGATDAIRAYGSLANGATSTTFASLRNLSGEPNCDAIVGTHYVHSIYIKNNHSTNQLNVTVNGLTAVGRNIHIYNPDSGETDIIDNTINTYVVPAGKIVKFVAMSIGSLTAQQAIRGLQFTFGAKNTSTKEFDFTYWHPQIEEGDTATEWEPSPYDNAKASELESLSNSLGGLAVKDSADWSDLSTKTKTLITAYGTCDTAANAAKKVVVCPGFSLEKGARIAVKFTYGNTADLIFLNVNNTGAKMIGAGGQSGISSNNHYSWNTDHQVLEFIYDGSGWIMLTPPMKNIYYGFGSTIDGQNIEPATISPSKMDNSIVENTSINPVNTSAGTWTNIFSTSLPAGKYLFISRVSLNKLTGSTGGSGRAALGITLGSSSKSNLNNQHDTCIDNISSLDAVPIMENTRLISLNDTTTVYGYCYQTYLSGGSGAQAWPSYSYIRL